MDEPNVHALVIYTSIMLLCSSVNCLKVVFSDLHLNQRRFDLIYANLVRFFIVPAAKLLHNDGIAVFY